MSLSWLMFAIISAKAITAWSQGEPEHAIPLLANNYVYTMTEAEGKHMAKIIFGAVSCGNHKASSCSKCGGGKNWCNGDCNWTNNLCVHKGAVSCGRHEASSCSECGDDKGWCNGDCNWTNNMCVHKDDDYLGCYVDSVNRLLPNQHSLPDNTPAKCISICEQEKFIYAGVQFGHECFCGNKIPLESKKTKGAECNHKCTGNSNQVCGAGWRMNMYVTGEYHIQQGLCDVGWNYFNGHCYWFSTDILSFDDAKARCNELNPNKSTLTSILNAEENMYITDKLQMDKGYLIGATDEAEEGVWTWTDGSPWSYTNWFAGQPNNFRNWEDHIVIGYLSGKWNDINENDNDYISGTSGFRYICKQKSLS